MGKYVNILVIILLAAAFIMAYVDYRAVSSKGAECLRDSLTYSVKQLELANPKAIILCQCTKSQDSSTLILKFDSSGNKEVINPNKQEKDYSINLSGVEVIK